MSGWREEAAAPQALMSVVDCSSDLPGRFAASVLAGMGAAVRRPEVESAKATATEMLVSRGVELVSPPKDRQAWETLVDPADVVLVDSSNGAWGTIEEIRTTYPQKVIVCTTSHGLANLDDVKKSTILTLAAESGFLGITGEPDGAPEALRGHALEFACSWAIASAAWAAFRQRTITREGILVDLSLLEMIVFLQWNATQRAAFEGVVMRRQGARGLGHPWGVYPCKDGHVILIVGAGGKNWMRFSELMGVPALADPRYQSAAARAEHADEIDALMLPWLMEHSAEEIFTLAQEASLPFGMVRRPEDLLRDRQFEAREFFKATHELRWPQLPFNINNERPHWDATVAGRGGR